MHNKTGGLRYIFIIKHTACNTGFAVMPGDEKRLIVPFATHPKSGWTYISQLYILTSKAE